MLPKPDGVSRLQAVIDETPRGRSELLELSGLSIELWRPAILYLLDTGHVRQLGTKRGARYVLVASTADLEGREEVPPAPSADLGLQGGGPRQTYHDLIAEVLRDLSTDSTGRSSADGAESETVRPAGLEPSCDEAGESELADDHAVERIRAHLISFRENTLQPDLQPGGRSMGLLRKTMIEALVRERPRNESEFLRCIPAHLLEGTNRSQIEEYLPAVLKIIRELDGSIDVVEGVDARRS